MSLDYSLIRRTLENLGGDVSDKRGVQLVQLLDKAMLVMIRKTGREPHSCENPDCLKIYPVSYDNCPYCGRPAILQLEAMTVSRHVPIPPGLSEPDAYVLQIERLGRATMRDLYETGRLFVEIKTKGIWEKDTKTNVDSFEEWVEARTGWSWSTAERLMTVAKTYTSEQIESTTRIKISGLLEIEKVMRSVPPEHKKEVLDKVLDKTKKKKKIPTARETAKLARDVRAEVMGEEDAEIIEVHEPDEVVAQPAPAQPLPASKKFSVRWEFQKNPGFVSVGDVFRVPIPAGIVEIRLGSTENECYLIPKE